VSKSPRRPTSGAIGAVSLLLAVCVISVLTYLGRPGATAPVSAAAPPAKIGSVNGAQAPAAAPTNDQCSGAEVIPTPSGANQVATSSVVDITDATTTGDPPNAPSCAFRSSRSVWFKFTPSTSATYVVETGNSATTLKDPVLGIFSSSTGDCSGVFSQLSCSDEPTTSGTGFYNLGFNPYIAYSMTAGTTYYIVVWKFGEDAPAAGESSVQVRIGQGSATATATIATGLPPVLSTTTPTPPGFQSGVYAYIKNPNDTLMRIRRTTPVAPAFGGCPAVYPPDIECDDDEGPSYTTTMGNAPIYPPSVGSSSVNSAVAGVPVQDGDYVYVQPYGSGSALQPYDVYIHRPDGSSGNLTESETNDTISGANAVPTLPPCTLAYSEVLGNQRPGLYPYTGDAIKIPPASAGWVMNGSIQLAGDVDYFGPFNVGANDAVFVAIDGSLNYLGAPHDQDLWNVVGQLSIRNGSDLDILTGAGGYSYGISGGQSYNTAGQFFSGTPGGTFYVRFQSVTASEPGRGYRLTACTLGGGGNSYTPTPSTTPATATPALTATPTSAAPGNDVCPAAPALALNVPFFATLAGATDHYQIPASAACWTANGAVGNTSTSATAGRDAVFSFTAPTAGNYNFKAQFLPESLASGSLANQFIGWTSTGNMAVYVATDCPTGTAPMNPNCQAAANRNSNTAVWSSSEEVFCLPLTAGQQVYVYVDEISVATSGGFFGVVVTPCDRETEGNGLPTLANTFACGIGGSIAVTSTPTPTTTQSTDPTQTPTPTLTPTNTGAPTATPTLSRYDNDFFALPTQTPPAGYRLFSLVDGVTANTYFYIWAYHLLDDILEYDASDNDLPFNSSSGNLAGTPLRGKGTYLRVATGSTSATAEPYHVYAVVQPPLSSAIPEAEPNDTMAQANFGTANYFYGALAVNGLRGPSIDLDTYKFKANAGDTIFVSIDGDPKADTGYTGKSPLQPLLLLLDQNGNPLMLVNKTTITLSYAASAGNPNNTVPGRGQGEALTVKALYSGIYYAVVAIGGTANTTYYGTEMNAGDYLLSISINCQTANGIAPTDTPTNTPTNTQTATATFTPTRTPTATNTPTNTPTIAPTNTATRTPTATNTSLPSSTPTATTVPATATPTNTRTVTTTPTVGGPSPTPTPVPLPSPKPVGGFGAGEIGGGQAPQRVVPTNHLAPVLGLTVLGMLMVIAAAVAWRRATAA
jgi:hypothetical protein